MEISSRSLCAALAIALMAVGCSSQAAPQADRVSGCYDVVRGELIPAMDLGADSLEIALPSRVWLEPPDTSLRPSDDWNRMRDWPGALPSIHRFQMWAQSGDTIQVVWSTGYIGVVGNLFLVKDGLEGTMETFWDSRPAKQSGPLRLESVPCSAPLALTRDHQRSLDDSLVLADGSVVRLGDSLPRPDVWVSDESAKTATRTQVSHGVLGAMDSIQVLLDDHGRIRRIVVQIDGTTTATDDVMRQAIKMWGPPVDQSTWDSRLRTFWANRSIIVWLTHETATLDQHSRISLEHQRPAAR